MKHYEQAYAVLRDKNWGRFLTNLSRMDSPIFIRRTSPFLIVGLLGGIFHFYSNFQRDFCKQTVENLIRCRILRCLIRFCTVCLCPTKRMLGLYRLMQSV